MKKTTLDENQYFGLREQVLKLNTNKLKIDNYPKGDPFGVIMEFELSNQTVTTVAFITGDASIYLSTGGGFIGGFKHKNIKDTAIALVKESEMYIEEMIKTDKYPRPKKGEVIFYILTDDGILTLKSDETSLQNKSIDYWKLYYLGQNLITEYRKISENQ
jgi:hypothetical protein